MLCIDGQIIVDAHEASGHWISSEGIQFGFGVFETIRVYKQDLEDLEAHLSRLATSAAALGIYVPPILTQAEALRALLMPLLSAIEQDFASLKIGLIKDGSTSHYWVQAKPFPYRKVHVVKGIKATLSQVHRNSSSLFAYHKTINYAENWFEKQKAVENGYQEVLFLNEDNQLAEGAVSNLFFIKEGRWHTPAVDCGILNGIMRQRTIQTLTALYGSVETGFYDLHDLETADYVFVTNALMGIISVNQINETVYKMPDQALNKILEQIDRKRLKFE